MSTPLLRRVWLLGLLLCVSTALVGCSKKSRSRSAPPLGLVYSEPSPLYELCGDIAENLPTVIGGTPTTFAITPSLPAGLELDTATGVIRGVPTETSPATVYTITAANLLGQASADITIEVIHVPPSGLSYPDLGDELGRGIYVEVKPLLALGHGSTFTVSSGSLPNGLTLDSLTGEISGVPTAFGNASFDITVEDCASASTLTAFATVVVVPYARGMCAADDVQGTVASFRRTHAGGAITHSGRVWNSDGTDQIVMHPWGRIAFAAAQNTVSVYAVESRLLELRLTEFSAATGTATVTDLAVANDGLHLFAATDEDLLYSYVVDPLSGELTPTSPAFVASAAGPRQIVVAPDGGFLYVACSGTSQIQRFSIDVTSGHLTALGTTVSGLGVRTLALTSDGLRLYAGSEFVTELYGYDVNVLDGSLSAATWSPTDVAESGHMSLALTPDDDHLYLALESSHDVRGFVLDAITGEPTDLPSGPVTGLGHGLQVSVEPRGGHLYSVHEGGWIHTWSIAGDGSLSSTPVAVCLASESTRELGFVLGHARFRVATQSIYATSVGNDSVYEYAFTANTGTLTAMPATPFATGQDPQTISLHPFRDFALVSHFSPVGAGAVGVHGLGESGELETGVNVGTSTSNVGLALDRSGAFAYLVRNASGTAHLTAYGFDATTGALDSLGTTSFAATAWPPAVHPSGRLVVVPDSLGDELHVFVLDALFGTVSSMSTVSTGGIDPFRVVFDGTGRFAYTAHLGNNRISVHSVDLATGTLAPIVGSPFTTGIRPLVMANSVEGTALMIADTLQGLWEYYTIDLDPIAVGTDGAPTLVGSGAQAGIAILRFDASGTKLIWVNSLTQEVVCSPITAPGTLGAPLSTATIGTQITSMETRDR